MVIPFIAAVMRDVFEVVPSVLKESAYANNLRTVDALIHVLRAFDEPSIPHVGEIDPLRDAKNVDFDQRIHDERRKKDLELWVPLAQFSHHGSDHRSQIGTILTLNGLEAPELDVWAYAAAEGAIADF